MAVSDYTPRRCAEALGYASLGLRVLPLHAVGTTGLCTCGDQECKRAGKHPTNKDGSTGASSDAEQVKAWFKSGFQNLGIATGDGMFVLDVDAGKGGLDTLKGWEALHGPIEAAWVCRTGSGGYHYYFKGEARNSQGKLGPGIDIRGTGGYVVAPPSIHASQNEYKWHKERRPHLRELTPAPEWLLLLMAEADVKDAKPKKSQERMAGAPEGQRNEAVFKLAASLRGQGVDLETALEQCRFTAANCSPPLPAREAENICHGVYNRYPEGGRPITVLERRIVSGEHEAKSFSLTDAGNAERLLYRLDGSVRYCHPFGKWIIWDGTRWRVDETGGAVLVQEAVRMVRDLAEMGDNAFEQKVVAKWSKECESRARISSMIDLAKAFATISPDELDRDPMLLGVANGTLDLETGELRDARKEDYITMSSPVAYDPEAECPKWEKFFEWAMGYEADPHLAGWMHLALGYSLTGLTTEQCLFFAHGLGANGKSTMLDVLKLVLGDYARTIPSDELMAQGFNSSIESTLARIKGARAVFCSETSGKTMNETTIKEIAGGEVVQARMKYGHPFEFRPTCKLWIAGNHKPRITGSDWGIWRRIRLVPFAQTVAEGERNPRLFDELAAEAPGILRFMVIGLQIMLSADFGRRLPACDVVMASTEEYRAEMDVLGQFIDECCELDQTKSIASGKLYSHYQTWAKASGHGVLSIVRFANQMKERGFVHGRNKSTKLWEGIDINDEVFAAEAWWQKVAKP